MSRGVVDSKDDIGSYLSKSLEACNRELHDQKFTGGIDDVCSISVVDA